MVEPPRGRMRRAAEWARRHHGKDAGGSAAPTVAAFVVWPLAAVGLLSGPYAEVAETAPRTGCDSRRSGWLADAGAPRPIAAQPDGQAG